MTLFVPFADTGLLSDETGITLSDKWTTDNVITTNIAVEDQVCFTFARDLKKRVAIVP